MRRLTEILAFPKAWYKRSIVRRLFLGDLSSYSSSNVEFLNTQQQYHIRTKLKSKMAHTDRHFKSNKGLLNIPSMLIKIFKSRKSIITFFEHIQIFKKNCDPVIQTTFHRLYGEPMVID